MSNKEITKQLRLTAQLIELHGGNAFKARAYTSAVLSLEKMNEHLTESSVAMLKALGLSDGMADKVMALLARGTFDELAELLAQTPEGVLDMMQVKGLGAKKVRALWLDLGILSVPELLDACYAGKIAEMKGFGAKTQAQIIEQIEYLKANEFAWHYSEALPFALQLQSHLKEALPNAQIELAGQLRRCMEVIDTLEMAIAAPDFGKVRQALANTDELAYQETLSGPYTWRGFIRNENIPVAIYLSEPESFASKLFLHTGNARHLGAVVAGKSLRQWASAKAHPSEQAIYEASGLPYLQPELREGTFELAYTEAPRLVEMRDLKGVLHNHSTYSDGMNTLQEMAEYAKDLGYEYLGISDHSQTAFYANGLNSQRIKEQHAEIDALNKQLAPFRIFKGIESDILSDGSLDYPDEILASFDFIVSSIHANLRMDERKATERLIKAIANPYTTILGHPTGRLLLKREGYPIDHQAVIDACAQHGVCIEINANPWRLDLDWRWVNYAMKQGVLLAINPDAHHKEGYADMRYGVLAGRKGGLTPSMTLNALDLAEISDFFQKRKDHLPKSPSILS